MSTPWSQKESEDRGKKFLDDYKSLCKKYEFELMSMPQLVPSGQNGFNIAAVIIPIDKKEQGTPSPFADEILK